MAWGRPKVVLKLRADPDLEIGWLPPSVLLIWSRQRAKENDSPITLNRSSFILSLDALPMSS